MVRVKRGNVARKRRKKILKLAKGFRGGLSKLFTQAKQAVIHALSYAYKDRRRKKRDFRNLWIVRINAALLNYKLSYSKFIGNLNKKNIKINRKMLAAIAWENPETFAEIVKISEK
ncbi:50S ribosomal protein L20 [Candidatus Margulisiibacteriota bacterium]